MKHLFNLLRMYANNIKALLNRKLSAAGFGGGIVNAQTELKIQHIRNGKVIKTRRIFDKVITTAFVNDIVDCLTANATRLALFDDYKYHASGTGTTAEAVGNTALVAEVETRVVGTQVEGSGTNIYQSVATVAYVSAHAITEHGLLNASTLGILMDRTVFPAINALAGDSIQFSFTIQFNAGG